MPEDPRDLCVVEDVVLQGRIGASGSTQSAEVIQELITTASGVIAEWTSREFAPPAAAATRILRYPGRGELSLSPWDLRVVTSLTIDTDTSTPTVLSTDRFRAVVGPDGVIESIELPGIGPAAGDRDRIVTVVGDWGFPAVPRTVKQACVVTVRAWLTREGGLGYQDDSEQAVAPGPPNIYWLPASARRLLGPFRRIPIG